MASYDSNKTEQPGQYPAPSWTTYGLPAQTFGSGAPGGSPTDSSTDKGDTNEPGQYPSRETFTGVALDGTGAPGTQGIPADTWGDDGGPDSITYQEPTFYKGENDDNTYDGQDGVSGYVQSKTTASVSGPADWTQANDYSYGPGFNMPGVEGNTPTPGSGDFQTGAGEVLYGGWLKGQRPGTTQHPGFSGPGS